MTGDASAGAPFFVPIPRESTSGNPEQRRAEHDRQNAPDDVTVLLIDGRDAETREILAALAECDRPKVSVEHVSDPKEAEHLWLRGEYDLVIVDVWLGRGISVELVTLLTSSPCTCPIVMLSSLAADELQTYFTDTDLFIHSKQNISPCALGATLTAALATDDDGF